MPTSILLSAKNHLQSLIARNKETENTSCLFAADNMAYKIAIYAINQCIAQNKAEVEKHKALAEFDAALAKLFSGGGVTNA